ncbi:MAG: hypothetical protein SH817_02285 [Leptospira sp.]|nr:hypothetical protein [Leptospira sp.]
MKKSIYYFLILSFAFTAFCSKGKEDDALAALLVSAPILSSVSPQIGTPRQNNENGVYAATDVVIKGSNFGIDTVVRFNDVVATITANLGTELYTSVPDNAISGYVTVSKSGGSCVSGTASGLNCTGSEFFIDCYTATGKQHGDEIEIKQGESKSIVFSGVQTKAFRTDLILGAANLTIGCDSVVTVRLFSPSCQATDYILQKDPTITLNPNSTSQFYVTAGSATCGLTI